MDYILNPNQSSGVKERDILDNILKVAFHFHIFSVLIMLDLLLKNL